MNIGLDFDGTYTEDPALWNYFIQQAQNRGHFVFVVTFRQPEHESLNQDAFNYLKSAGCRVIFTNRVPKMKFCEIIGVKIDVWIDDNPYLIVNESDWTQQEYDEWQKEEAKRVEEQMAQAKAAEDKKKKRPKKLGFNLDNLTTTYPFPPMPSTPTQDPVWTNVQGQSVSGVILDEYDDTSTEGNSGL